MKLIETALEGREITVGVLERKGEILVLPITEIVSENDFFDYEAKYEGESEEITPAIFLEYWRSLLKTWQKLYKSMGLRNNPIRIYFCGWATAFIEVNTIPGWLQV